MSVSTNLYLSQRWELDDIKTIIERTQETKVTITSHHSFAFGYFTMEFKGRQMHLHSQHNTPIGNAILLSMYVGQDEESHKILRAIAEVLGGIFMQYDYDGNCELIDGAMNEGNALPYFVKYTIVNDGIDCDSIDQLTTSRESWEQKHLK